MEINFEAAIAALGGAQGIARLANEARAPASYLLQTTVLPVRLRAGYTADDAGMVIRSVMAGMVGMDSKLPEGGAIDFNSFRENIAKFGMQQNLSERTKRQLRETINSMLGQGQQGQVGAVVVQTVLNFVQKMLLQPMWDRTEWLCGQVLFLDEINWRFNGSRLALNYQTPAEHLFATRTGTDAYGGTTSRFWEDHRQAQRLLKGADYLVIAHGNTINDIVYNDANSANILAAEGGRFQIQRYRGTLERPSTDARDTATFVSYNLEGEVLKTSGDSQTAKIPFAPEGMLLYVARGNPDDELVQIGEGSTENVDRSLELGYVHLGPTEEAEGALGLWARVYKPEDMPMQLRGQTAANMLPVMRNGTRRVVLSTALQP